MSHRQHHSNSSGLSLINAPCGLDCDAGGRGSVCVCVCLCTCVCVCARVCLLQNDSGETFAALEIRCHLPRSRQHGGQTDIIASWKIGAFIEAFHWVCCERVIVFTPDFSNKHGRAMRTDPNSANKIRVDGLRAVLCGSKSHLKYELKSLSVLQLQRQSVRKNSFHIHNNSFGKYVNFFS